LRANFSEIDRVAVKAWTCGSVTWEEVAAFSGASLLEVEGRAKQWRAGRGAGEPVIEPCQYFTRIEGVAGVGELGRLGELVHLRGHRGVVARPRCLCLGLDCLRAGDGERR
jgi:hypothetical protein